MYNGSTLFAFHNEEKTKHTALQWVDYVAANMMLLGITVYHFKFKI